MGQGEVTWNFRRKDAIVKEVRKSFRDIGRYCPEDIVKKSRGNKRRVKKPGNKEISNLLIQLDNEIKVNIEDGHVKKFSNTILKFVKGITYFIEESSGLLFKINPAGSFPLGNKIEHIDEFDFVLEWINVPKELTELTILEIGNLYFKEGTLIEYPRMIIHQLLLECLDVENITIKTLIQKKFAMNLVISWKCLSCHTHEVSLDLAVCLKSKDAMQKYLKMMGISFKDTPFEETIKSDEFVYHCFPFAREGERNNPFEECRVDTNFFDKCIFDRCDEISLNIKSCFRIIKFICSKVFPRYCKIYKCVLQHESMDVCDFEPFISSYVLKQLLFKEVIEFPTCKDWSIAFIHLRITSLFKRLKKVSKIQDFLNPLEIKNVRNEQNELLFQYFDNYMIKLISWFQNSFKEERKDTMDLKTVGDDTSQLWFYRNVLIITAKEAKIFCPEYSVNYPIFKLIVPVTRAKTSNMQKFIYEIYNQIVCDIPYLDLRTQSDMYFSLFVILYSSNLRVLGEEDVKSNKVIEKLNTISEIAEKFEVTFKTVYSALVKGKTWTSWNDDVVMKISSIFSQVTMKEAGSIYRYFEKQDSRNKNMPYNVNENNGKEISLLEKVMELLGTPSTIDKACIWLYSATMKSLGKI